MRILIVSFYFPPLRSVASSRVFMLAKFLERQGHEITVLTTKKLEKHIDTGLNAEVVEIDVPILNRWTFWGRKKLEDINTDNVQNTRQSKNNIFKKINSFRAKKGIGFLGRMPDLVDFWIRPAKKWVKEQENFDVVISSYGPYASHLIGRYIKKKKRANYWVADFRDPWTDNHLFSGIWPFTMLERYLEKRIISECDLVTTVNPEIKYLLQTKNYQSQIEIIKNGIDKEEFETLTKKPFFKDKSKLRWSYTGTIYENLQNLNPFFDSLEELIEKEPELVKKVEVILAGTLNENVKKRLKSSQTLTKVVKFIGLLNKKDALRIQRDSDFLLFFGYGRQNHIATSAKIYEYFHSRKKCYFLDVNTEFSEYQNIQKLPQCLILENTKAAIIRAMKSDIEGGKSILKSVLNIDFSFDKQVQKLVTILEKKEATAS